MSFFQASQSKFYIHFLSLQFVFYASSFFIWSLLMILAAHNKLRSPSLCSLYFLHLPVTHGKVTVFTPSFCWFVSITIRHCVIYCTRSFYMHFYGFTKYWQELMFGGDNKATKCMQHNPSWEANSFSASEEISRILWNQRVCYRADKSLPVYRILTQI
jgi:hypothetical protein